MEKNAIVQPRPSRFGRALLYFLLGLLGLVVLSQYLGGQWDGLEEPGKGKIGLVEVVGFIADSREVVRQIRRYREDDSIKGIILRIDSPGGSVAPSQEIYSEVLRTREKKKVYASMGSVAASGGYYIAAAADRVFANPGTLTGSIGVIMAFTNVEGLLKKIGLKPEVIKAGQFKDTGNPGRALTPKERKYLQNVVRDVHQQFIEAVAEGRRMDPRDAKKLADGRIFTGRQALKMKMVDDLGGLEDAIAQLGEVLGISGRPKVVQEVEKESLLQWLLRNQLPDSLDSSMLTPEFPQLQYLWSP